jgi:hypothetical protein
MFFMRILFVAYFATIGYSNLFAGVDSGGGISPVGNGTNHSSIGSPLETGTASLGLIEILYPAAPNFNSELDIDGNGLPDSWELQHFGQTGAIASADADRDGTTNMMEYLAGTDPNSSASVFRPTNHLDSGFLILTIPTASGRHYRVWGTSNLQTGWGAAPFETIVGDGSVIELQYPMSNFATGRYFFKIEILIPEQN